MEVEKITLSNTTVKSHKTLAQERREIEKTPHVPPTTASG